MMTAFSITVKNQLRHNVSQKKSVIKTDPNRSHLLRRPDKQNCIIPLNKYKYRAKNAF